MNPRLGCGGLFAKGLFFFVKGLLTGFLKGFFVKNLPMLGDVFFKCVFFCERLGDVCVCVSLKVLGDVLFFVKFKEF